MKCLYSIVIAFFCGYLFAHTSLAQEKIWFTSSSLAYCDTDGSNITASTDFDQNYEESNAPFGRDAGFIMQASRGDIYVVTTSGGNEDYGTIVRVSRNGIKKVTDLGYAMHNAFLTEGRDGYIYGIKPNAFDYDIFRFRLDGTGFQEKRIATYGMRESELTTSLTGEILGTTRHHLYKFKPDLSGITKIFAYQKSTGNSPIGKLHQSPDGYLYGVTRLGGAKNYGVVYRVKPTGEEYKVLHEFNLTNGRFPDRGLTGDTKGNLYGVTMSGGRYQRGVLFRIRKDGSAYEILHHFIPSDESDYSDLPNSLQIDKDGNLYGEPPGYYGRAMFKFVPVTKTYSTPIIGNMRIQDINIFREISPAIQVLRPSSGATNVPVNDTHRVTFIPGSLSYTVEFSTVSDFSKGVLSSTSTSSRNMPGANLAYNKRYYARAKSSLWPYYGKTISFTTGTAESLSFITIPKDGSINAAAPTLKVTASQVRGAKRYTIQLSTSQNFSAGVITKVSSVDNQRTLTFTDIAYSTRYYARMKTDISGYGRVTSFTTKEGPEMAMAALDLQAEAVLDVHPNPSTSFFNVTFKSNSSPSAQVVITKLTGEVVENHIIQAGDVRQVGHNIEKGIYIFKIVTEEGVLVRRVVKK